MEVFQRKNAKIGINKRKRLDARTFKEWHVSQAKKLNNGLIRDGNLQKSKEKNHETSCSKEKDSTSELQKVDSDVKSHPGNGEATSSVPQGFELASSSKIVLSCETPHGEMIDHGPLGSKESLEDLPGCNTKVPRFIEYWVPVGLSYLQLEKYCETLIKNSMFLCSRVRNEILDDVHGILTTIKKCCDHPYLVDQSLQKFVNNERPGSGYLCNGIEASGKLLLLDRLLQEVKDNQLRVLIVCQSNELNTQKVNLEHMIDDLLHHRIGKGRYVHIYKEADSAKKRADVNLFNDKEQGMLVMLIEKNACHQNIKLSSLDCVILFNSEWSPITDIKNLRKMSIESKFDHLKVFRLYTSRSVEEKALKLAMEGPSLEIGLNYFSYNISHMLLLWGTSYLFSKLDEFHSCCSTIADIRCLSEDNMVSDVFNELLALLSCQDSSKVSCSFISKVPEACADYPRNIALHGEQDETAKDSDLTPSTIWNSLLERRNPLWKLLPGSSEKTRRRGEALARTAQHAECDNDDGRIKKAPYSGNGFFCPKSRVGKVNKPASSIRAPIRAGYPHSHCNSTRLSSFREDYSSPSQRERTLMQKMGELIRNQKMEIRKFYRTKSEARMKLEEERQLEVELLSQRYGETPFKQEELKNLDLIYDKKLQEHNRLMDIKRKELEDEHLTSRKQLKEKFNTLLEMENVKTPTVSLVKMPLENASPQQSVDVIGNSSDSTVIVSNNSVSESNHSHAELGRLDASVQRNDLKFPPDHVQTETEILSVGTDEANDSVSMPREDVSDSAESGASATVVGQRRIVEVQNGECNIEAPIKTFNIETEIRGAADSDDTVALTPISKQERVQEVHDEDCNVQAINGESEMRDVADSGATATMVAQKRMEELQDGDCNIDVLIGEVNGDAELGGVPDLCVTATGVTQQRIEEVQDGRCIIEATIWEHDGEAELQGASDSVTNATVVVQKEIEEVQDGDCSTGALTRQSNGGAELSGAPDCSTAATVAAQQRIEEVQDRDCNTNSLIGLSNEEAGLRGFPDSGITSTVAPQHGIEEVQDVNCNIDAPVDESIEKVELRGAVEMGATVTVAGLQRIENVQFRNTNIGYPIGPSNGEDEMRGTAGTSTIVVGQQRIAEPPEVAPSRLNVDSEVVQSQACTWTGNSLPLEQPMISANLPCSEIRETARASAVSNLQTIRVHAPSQQGQAQVHSENSGLSDQPVLQSLALQLPSVWEQPHPNSSTAFINQSTNNYFQRSSSLRSNVLTSVGPDPVHMELLRLMKENEAADKNREAKLTLFKSVYEKKVKEIQEQYDELCRETESAYLENKRVLESRYYKVYANKLLADSVRVSSTSLDCPLGAFLDFSLLNFPMQSSVGGSATSPSAPVQVVNQLSELVTFGATRPQNFVALHNTGNSVAGNYGRSSAPHLHAQPRQVTSPCTSNMVASSYGIMNQQAAVLSRGPVPSWHQPELLQASSSHLGATSQNPFPL